MHREVCSTHVLAQHMLRIVAHRVCIYIYSWAIRVWKETSQYCGQDSVVCLPCRRSMHVVSIRQLPCMVHFVLALLAAGKGPTPAQQFRLWTACVFSIHVPNNPAVSSLMLDWSFVPITWLGLQTASVGNTCPCPCTAFDCLSRVPYASHSPENFLASQPLPFLSPSLVPHDRLGLPSNKSQQACPSLTRRLLARNYLNLWWFNMVDAYVGSTYL
jgi:hypothetical protein